ncbi:hypothetical protein OSB04_010116 [Centaurea solstitialis]|uniref:Uncharacterized protein n=1 Tax=Centaurea solstitialis TaxID=347529 RepID=A0AA38WBL0_9ASTR|nr:hypothetical protein OSB04_010116 [Centaurea solstitialis]
MIAVGTNQSHQFVKDLLSNLSKDDLMSSALAAKNHIGDNVFHYAAKIGNMIDAEQLVLHSRKPTEEILMHENDNGDTPLMYAASFGRKKKMLDFFFSLTGVPINVISLLLNAIDARFLGTYI